jgi:hypothetical protein
MVVEYRPLYLCYTRERDPMKIIVAMIAGMTAIFIGGYLIIRTPESKLEDKRIGKAYFDGAWKVVQKYLFHLFKTQEEVRA